MIGKESKRRLWTEVLCSVFMLVFLAATFGQGVWYLNLPIGIAALLPLLDIYFMLPVWRRERQQHLDAVKYIVLESLRMRGTQEVPLSEIQGHVREMDAEVLARALNELVDNGFINYRPRWKMTRDGMIPLPGHGFYRLSLDSPAVTITVASARSVEQDTGEPPEIDGQGLVHSPESECR